MGLIWPHENSVILAGVILEVFEKIIESKNLLQVIKHYSFSSSAALSALRLLIHEKVGQCVSSKIFEVTCKSCYLSSKMPLRDSIISTMFNIGANNFTMLLNRRENGLKISMKMVKLLKSKDTYLEIHHSFESESECIKKWTIKRCKEKLKLHKASQTGNLKILQERCILLNTLIQHNLQLLFSQSMNELSLMSKHLHLTKGTKDEMVRNISNVIICNDSCDINSLMIAINSFNNNV